MSMWFRSTERLPCHSYYGVNIWLNADRGKRVQHEHTIRRGSMAWSRLTSGRYGSDFRPPVCVITFPVRQDLWQYARLLFSVAPRRVVCHKNVQSRSLNVAAVRSRSPVILYGVQVCTTTDDRDFRSITIVDLACCFSRVLAGVRPCYYTSTTLRLTVCTWSLL